MTPLSPNADMQIVFPRLHAGNDGIALVEGGARIGLQTVENGFAQPIPFQHELLPVALDNLAKAAGEWHSVDTVPGMAFFHANDGMVSERLLLLPRLWPKLPAGGLLAAIPASNRLLIQPLHRYLDVQSLDALANSTQLVHQTADQPLSPHIYWYDGERWDMLFVHAQAEAIELHPPASFLETVERLARLSVHGRAVEA